MEVVEELFVESKIMVPGPGGWRPDTGHQAPTVDWAALNVTTPPRYVLVRVDCHAAASPRHSMYAIYAYIGVVLGVNVGIYGIHGVSGSLSRPVCQLSVASVTSQANFHPMSVGPIVFTR